MREFLDVYLGAVCEVVDVARISSVDIVVVKVRIEDWIDTYVALISAKLKLLERLEAIMLLID